MSVSALGTTPTEMSIKGETSVLLTTIEGALRKISTDEPLPEGSKLVVGVTANGDTAVVAVNVIGECPSSGLSDGRL
jgi:hypothetical protein